MQVYIILQQLTSQKNTADKLTKLSNDVMEFVHIHKKKMFTCLSDDHLARSGLVPVLQLLPNKCVFESSLGLNIYPCSTMLQ